MKIGIYITDITRGAGTERAVIALANHLVMKKHQVTIVSFASKVGRPFYVLDPFVEICHLGLNAYANKSVYYKWYSYLKKLLVAYSKIRQFPFDIIIGTSRNVNILALIYKRRKQKILGCEHFSYNSPLPKILCLFRNTAYKLLDKLIVLTETDCNYYRKKNIDVCVIPNAIPFEPISCWDKKRNIVLAIGRHSKEKAFDKLLHIWSKVRCKEEGWLLYIVGDGILREKNYKLVQNLHLENSVVFVEPTLEIRKYYLMASIYVMTSLYEALPMVLLEAKANEIPLISYDCETGPKFIIKNGKDGFLIPFDDEKEFVVKLDLLSKDIALRKSMGKRALEDSYNYIPQKIMHLWDGLLSKYE